MQKMPQAQEEMLAVVIASEDLVVPHELNIISLMSHLFLGDVTEEPRLDDIYHLSGYHHTPQ